MLYSVVSQSDTIVKITEGGREYLYKKVYCSCTSSGDYVMFSTHEIETGLGKQQYKFLYSDCLAPSSGSASALVTAINQIINSYVLDPTTMGTIDLNNTTNTALNAGATFTGAATDVSQYASIVVSAKTDQDGVLTMQFSVDGTNWDSVLTTNVAASTNEVHRLSVTKQYFRVEFNNSSASNQTYLRLQSLLGSQTAITSSLNTVIQQDADALTTRTIDPELVIAQSLFQGYSIVNKVGRNPSTTAISVPEDVWNNSTIYTGFPTGSPEEIQIVLSSASDVGGVVTFQYLATSTSTAWVSATITTTGTTTNTGVTAYRVHTCQFASGTATGFNVGTVTLRHRTTTANVFIVMPIGKGQSYASGYTVPTGSTGYIRRLFCRVYSNNSVSVEGGLWVRASGSSPRIRRPFEAGSSSGFEEYPYGGITISGGSDLIVRITSTTGSLSVIAGYDLILVKN